MNAVTPQFKMHSLILDIADTVQAEMSFAFAKEDRANSDAWRGPVGFRQGQVELPHIIDKAAHGENIKGTQSAFLSNGLFIGLCFREMQSTHCSCALWVIVVSMD